MSRGTNAVRIQNGQWLSLIHISGSGALFTIENLTYTDVVQAALSCVPERADEVKNLIANLTGGQGRLLGEELRVVRV